MQNAILPKSDGQFPRLMIHIYGFPLGPYDGFSFFIFIFFKSKKPGQVLINHEKIHFYQQLELLFVFHWILYVANYLVLLIYYLFSGKRKGVHHLAYRNICFEKEAYAHESDLSYLSKRRLFGWMKYL
jgi:hypothetical protein